MVAPFGDGKTTRNPGGIDEKDAGDNEYGLRGDIAERGTAKTAPADSASSEALSSSHGAGKITAPREVATSTAVEKDNTSTTITTSEVGPRTARPSIPQSNRTSKPA